MNRFDDSELDPELPAQEREGLVALAERLERDRPIPATGFRGELRRRLLGRLQPGRATPARLRALVAAYGCSGFALFAIAALGVGGVGPLSAG